MLLRRIISICLTLTTAIVLWSAPPAEAADRPNIVFILADDLGWTDLGCQGSQYYESPHIDRLAAEGMRLTNFHACQNCQPTRAALLSGQYAPRTGVYTVGGIDRFNWRTRPLRPVDNVQSLPLEKITIAQRLKQAGYATGMFGKWHLGNGAEYHPSQRGFDEAIVSNGRHFNFDTNPKTPYAEGTYLADFLTDRAVDFIRRHRDERFFLYLPHFAVHSPLEAKQEWIERFQNKSPSGGHQNPVYAAMIASLDESVGRVLATLDELQLADTTLVIFSSDNGGVGGYVREGIKRRGDTTDNQPLRSGKGSLYEGGTRVPTFVRWPGVTAKGTRCDLPAIHVDLYPTLLEAAGITTPADYPLDGVSLLPVLRDPNARLPRDDIFQHCPGYLGADPGFWRTTPVSLIQSDDWKLMEFLEDGRLELYNLRNDLGEQHNLAAEMPEMAQQLRGKLAAWRQAVGAKMPTPNTNADEPVQRRPNRQQRQQRGAAQTPAPTQD